MASWAPGSGDLYLGDLYLPVRVFYLAPLSGPAAIFVHGHDAVPTYLCLQAVQVVLFAVAYAMAPGSKKTLFLSAGLGWWVLCGLLAVVVGV